MDVIRDYPDYSIGSRRWDERVYHPDRNGTIRPLASLWKQPPGYIELIFSGVRLLEVAPVRRAMQLVLGKPEHQMRFVFGDRQEVAP